MGEGVGEAWGEFCVGDEDGEAEWAAGRAVLQALRQPAVPAARASMNSRRCMGGTFSKVGCQSVVRASRTCCAGRGVAVSALLMCRGAGERLKPSLSAASLRR